MPPLRRARRARRTRKTDPTASTTQLQALDQKRKELEAQRRNIDEQLRQIEKIRRGGNVMRATAERIQRLLSQPLRIISISVKGSTNTMTIGGYYGGGPIRKPQATIILECLEKHIDKGLREAAERLMSMVEADDKRMTEMLSALNINVDYTPPEIVKQEPKKVTTRRKIELT